MTKRERQLLNWIEENPLISQKELAEKAGITRSSVAVHISNLMKKGYITGKGYIVQTAPYVTVVGAVNVDIGGRSEAALVPRDSNPGAVHTSLGGVGRNIAHNMALLGLDVRLVTAFGDDLNAQKIAANCAELGMDPENYWWYCDLRRYGSCRHAGFGLGFERLVMYLTGVNNIRDVLLHPRTVGNAEF